MNTILNIVYISVYHTYLCMFHVLLYFPTGQIYSIELSLQLRELDKVVSKRKKVFKKSSALSSKININQFSITVL